MHALRQTLVLTAAAIRSIPDRLGASLVTVIGITTVMGVLITMLALGEGVERLVKAGIRDDRAAVISKGAQSMLVSSLPHDALGKVVDKPGIKRDAQGKPLVSGVLFVFIDGVSKKNQRAGISVFAVGPQWRQIWPEVSLAEGRFFEPGLHELLVSERVRSRFKGMQLGDSVNARGSAWKIVGVFKSTSPTFDNSLIADADTVLAAFPQSSFAGIDVVLQSPATFGVFKKAVADDPTLAAQAQTEAEANEAIIKGIRTLLDFISYFIGTLMGIGAVCGALSSLFAAVDTRTREIATLRAIGFGSGPVVVSVLAEGMILAIPAALLGAGIAWFLFNGHVVVAVGVTFQMAVTAHLVVVSLGWSLSIALIGGFLPALRAADLPVATALRAS